MVSIISITFNPCIDKSISVSSLLPEKKLRCSTPVLEPGGGGVNVARAIKRLGDDAVALFPYGGHTGHILKQLLIKESIIMIAIETVNETRENLIVLDKEKNDQYRFVMPGPFLYENEWLRCLEAIRELRPIKYIVASGSLPPGVPANVYARLSIIAKELNAVLIVDTSGEPLKHAVDAGVYLIKPNLSELALLAGVEYVKVQDVAYHAKAILSKKNVDNIVVSLGKEGAILFSGTETCRVNAPEVDIKSTVGAGDSMVAGLVYSISRGMNMRHALAYGVACGTAATLNPGTELCRKEDVEKLYAQIMNEQLEISNLVKTDFV